MSMQSEQPAGTVTPAATLSFVIELADESLDLWPECPAESYAKASAEGRRRAIEFIQYLRADANPTGMLLQLTRGMGMPLPQGPERGYLAGFFFALEAELARPVSSVGGT